MTDLINPLHTFEVRPEVKTESHKRKRVRTGCLTCRKRHRKCDELHPRCQNCEQKGFDCFWPVKTEIFVNNSQTDFTSPHKRRVGNRIGDRILSTLQLEKIPALIDPLTTKPSPCTFESLSLKQRSSSLDTGLPRKPIAEFTGMAESPINFTTTNALDKYSYHLQAISLLPCNSKMDLPTLLNGSDLKSTTDTVTSGLSPRSFKDSPNSIDDFFSNITDDSSILEFNDYNNLHNILRDFMYLKKNNNNEFEDLNVFLPEDVRTFEDLIDVHSDVVEPQLTDIERTELLRNYAMVCAPSLEMFDTDKHFSREIPRLAMECPALLYACLAYSAKHMERLNPTYPKEKLVELYRYSLQELIPTIKTSSFDLKIVCACVLLCCLEMMSSSPMNWRRHLEGCFALFTSFNINGFSENSLSRALFWAFARMDICSSIISEQPTIIPFKNWIPQAWSEYNLLSEFTLSKYHKLDMYANYMVFLCSRVMNLLYNDKLELDFDVEWERLLDELKEWELNRPPDMLPIISFFDASQLNPNHGTPERQHTSPFPTALFTNSPAISGNQMFHMAVILMMQNKPRLFKLPLTPTGNKYSMIHRSIMSHARQIIAISVTNRDHGLWINMIQPFWILGKLMGAEDEQKLILKTIKELEELTGWAIAWRGRDLVEYWNRNI